MDWGIGPTHQTRWVSAVCFLSTVQIKKIMALDLDIIKSTCPLHRSYLQDSLSQIKTYIYCIYCRYIEIHAYLIHNVIIKYCYIYTYINIIYLRAYISMLNMFPTFLKTFHLWPPFIVLSQFSLSFGTVCIPTIFEVAGAVVHKTPTLGPVMPVVWEIGATHLGRLLFCLIL